MLVLICMLPAGMCTQQTWGSHYCAAVTPTPPPLPTPLETGPRILNNSSTNDWTTTMTTSTPEQKKKACRLTVSLMTPLSAKTNRKKTRNELAFNICRQAAYLSHLVREVRNTDSHLAQSRGCGRPSVPSPTAAPGRGSQPWH